ncbi:MAG: ABC transporter permease [Acidobacteriota bacterium]|jgi:ABC-type transport system involved in multi-copper enzyme maturation permease subunit
MSRILVIARNTFRENIRDKVLYNLILFALIMILSSLLIGQLSLGNEVKIILDLGLASISIFGMLIAVFLGIGLVYKEIDKRTIFALLAKPVHRYEFILGKYLGLLYTLFVNVIVMAIGLELAILYHGTVSWDGLLRLVPAVFLIFLSLALVTAIALLFSTFSTPALSALFTFFLWVIGHFSRDLLRFSEISESGFVKWICSIAYYVIPNLTIFKIVDSRYLMPDAAAVYRQADPVLIGSTTLYCLLYCAVILSLSVLIFLRRDFK